MTDFILASQSPRRREILTREGFSFTVLSAHTKERTDFMVSPAASAMAFAFEKAHAVAKEHSDRFVLGADTVVSVAGRILGKPRDAAQAREFLRLLSDSEHRVITGFAWVCLARNVKTISYDETVLRFRKITDAEADGYIATGEPFDKAGGYGIQGQADMFLESMTGSLDNVVGLPVQKIREVWERIR